MNVELDGVIRIVSGKSLNFHTNITVTAVGSGAQGSPKLPIGRFLLSEVTATIKEGAVHVSLHFGQPGPNNNFGWPLKYSPDDIMNVVLEECKGEVAAIEKFYYRMSPTHQDLVVLCERLKELGYGT